MTLVSNFKNLKINEIEHIIELAIRDNYAHKVLQHSFYTNFLNNDQIDRLVDSTISNNKAWFVVYYSKAFSNFMLDQRDKLIDNVIKTKKEHFALNSITNLKYLTGAQIENCVSSLLYTNPSNIEELDFFTDTTFFYNHSKPLKTSVVSNFNLLTENQKERLLENGLENIHVCFSLLINTTCYNLSSIQAQKCINTICTADYEKLCNILRLYYLEKISCLYKPKTDFDKSVKENIIHNILRSVMHMSDTYWINILINERPRIIKNLSKTHLSYLVTSLCSSEIGNQISISELFLDLLPEDIAEKLVDSCYAENLKIPGSTLIKF